MSNETARFLRRYQQWRKGEIESFYPDSHSGPEPKEVTAAIDAAIVALEPGPAPMSGERMTDAALAEYCERAARNWTKGCDMHIGLMCASAALRARPQAVAEVYCVGRANYPPRGGNVGLQWHVVGVADVPYRTCVPKNGELLFVLAASQSATGGE